MGALELGAAALVGALAGAALALLIGGLPVRPPRETKAGDCGRR